MTIPDQVKVRGKIHQVHVSGRGYVMVGDVACDARKFFDSDIAWEKFKTEASPAEWQATMHKCFEIALRDFRKQQRSHAKENTASNRR